jgi:murein DD-endopeptidase MepM/ murein hydrolase activator NlpD
MPAQKASNIMKALLLLCMALSLTACLPKDLFKVSADQAHQEAVESVGTLDAELAMDREIEEASLSPSSLVGSENLSVSSLSSHDALFGSSLELAEEDYSLLPAGLMMLEGPEALPEPGYVPRTAARAERMPALGSAEAKALASLNTKRILCKPGDRVCMTSPYGVRRGRRVHKGIDIRAPLGSPIMAFKGGVVTKAEYNRTYGYMVDIQQDDGLLARYAHMSQILTHKGARVTKGLRIGRIGSTGRSTGPHLHFELLRDNRQTNPMVFLNSLDHLVKQGDAQDYEAARKALAQRGPHKKGKRYKAASGKSSGKRSGKAKAMPATYKIKNGDTLWDIARAHGTSVSAIQAANGGSIKNLKPGKTIRMPKR